MYNFVVEYQVSVFRVVKSLLKLIFSPLWIRFLLYEASSESF